MPSNASCASLVETTGWRTARADASASRSMTPSWSTTASAFAPNEGFH
jgi:hypothetical protein